MVSGLNRLQQALDNHEEPDDWPEDVCRDAWCGHWERNNGQYFWHRPSDHGDTDGPE
jgi:hypothetical protein